MNLVVVSKPTSTTCPGSILARSARLLDAEDRPEHGIYNHVAGLSAFSRDDRWLRRLRTCAVLSLLNMFYRTQFVKGQLVTIPSIHFASWTLVINRGGPAVRHQLPRGRRPCISTTSSTRWRKASPSSGTTRCRIPRTTDARRAESLGASTSQTLASVRYRAEAYANLTVAAINNNTHIRKRLLRGMLRTRPPGAFSQRFTSTLPGRSKHPRRCAIAGCAVSCQSTEP